MSEVDTLNTSCAIIEAYRMEGSKIYATRYVEPGNQKEASITYIPTDEVLALMQTDPNALQDAKNALFKRTRTVEKSRVRNPINKSKNGENAEDKVKEGVKTEIQSLQEQREKYVESLGGTN